MLGRHDAQQVISIHSPHARGDAESGCGASGHDISIRSPHARGDRDKDCVHRASHISIHSPHTRGDARQGQQPQQGRHFNPLSSYEGRLWASTLTRRCGNFNPLPSCEGRQPARFGSHRKRDISIHSPHTRGDDGRKGYSRGFRHFNPLPSCEGRQTRAAESALREAFQSTPLMRGETAVCIIAFVKRRISIHSPHARGDPRDLIDRARPRIISIHSPHARGDG